MSHLLRIPIVTTAVLVTMAMVFGTSPLNIPSKSELPLPQYVTPPETPPEAPLNTTTTTLGYNRKPFKFHIYDVPAKYISGAVEELHKNWGHSVCNRDVKKKTNYTMFDWRHAHSLFTVDTFIARHLRSHPDHTADPEQADIFIIPTMSHLYNCAGHMEYLIEVINWVAAQPGGYWKRYHAHDHYIFWWRWGMHYSSTVKFHKQLMRLYPKINYISYEYLEIMGRNKYQDFSLALKPKFTDYMHSVVVPYPDFSPGLKDEVPLGVARDIAVFMSGTSTIGGVRRWVKRELETHSQDVGFKCVYQDFGAHVVDTKRLGVPTDYPDMFKRSVFCVHAAGDGLSSRRPTSAVLAGCIPVLVCDLCLYAFERMLDYSSFAIFMPEDDVISGRMVDILKAIPQEEIFSKRKALRAIRPHFTYNPTGPPNPQDALFTLVESLSARAPILREYKRWFMTHRNLSTNIRDYPADPPLVNRYKMSLADDPTQRNS